MFNMIVVIKCFMVSFLWQNLFSLRFQFLESLETWRIEAMERANSVVAAKVTEHFML